MLLIERGESWLSVYNQWLRFRAAQDLIKTGSVECLGFEKIVADNFEGFTVIHKERKNFGMTYVYILQKD